MNFKDLRNRNWYPYTVASCSAVLLAFLLMNIELLGSFFAFIWKIICPLVVGSIIAYMMDPVARALERKVFPKINIVHLGRKAAVVMTSVIIYGSLFILFASLIPSLIRSISALLGNIDGYEKSILEFFNLHGFDDVQVEKNLSTIVAKIKTLVPELTKDVVDASPNIGGRSGNIGLGCILSVYFLLYKKRIVPWIMEVCKKLIRKESYQEFIGFCERCDTILRKYIACTLLDGLIVGVSNAVYMLIFHIPFVALISVIVGVTNLLPTFGPMVGGVIGFTILILMKPSYAFLFLIFTLFIQTIDGYVIKPKFFGNSLGVSSLWILISIICGGKVFGVVGVLMAIPFAAIAQYLLEEILFPKVKEERKTKIRGLWREEK